MMESAIYCGTIRHRRFAPRRHEFTYPVFLAYLDIDRIPELMSVSNLCSHNGWNWAAFYDADHFGDLTLTLRERLAQDARKRGIELADGQIFLLTNLRYLGYNFNPVSFFYCFDRMGDLQQVLAEVNNTFGETHNYWLHGMGRDEARENPRRYEFGKEFHVSPFLSLDCRYRWTFTVPGKALIVQSNVAEHGEPVFDGTLQLEHSEWSAASIRRALLSFPWITAKVIASIHWQAFRLLIKGIPVVQHPCPGRYTAANERHFGASWRAK